MSYNKSIKQGLHVWVNLSRVAAFGHSGGVKTLLS